MTLAYLRARGRVINTIAGLASLASILGYQVASLASCPNASGCDVPDNCTISTGSWQHKCSYDGLNCCSFSTRRWDYSGSGCVSAGGFCIQQSNSTAFTGYTCANDTCSH